MTHSVINDTVPHATPMTVKGYGDNHNINNKIYKTNKRHASMKFPSLFSVRLFVLKKSRIELIPGKTQDSGPKIIVSHTDSSTRKGITLSRDTLLRSGVLKSL